MEFSSPGKERHCPFKASKFGFTKGEDELVVEVASLEDWLDGIDEGALVEADNSSLVIEEDRELVDSIEPSWLMEVKEDVPEEQEQIKRVDRVNRKT
ncbi:MAG: hypothetical protein MJ239_03635 [Bacilli bacterium]|nr:hypothetical protein [Bacilli bacterium]